MSHRVDMGKDNKIAIFCDVPYRFINGKGVTAHNMRSQQFIDVLSKNNVPLIVVTRRRGLSAPLERNKVNVPFELWEYNDYDFRWRYFLKKALEKENVGAAIGFHLAGVFAISMLRPHYPIWLDLYGDPLIEKLGSDSLVMNQRGTLFLRRELRRAMMSADRFSVCSESQKDLLVGAVLYLGKLNHKNWSQPIFNVINYSDHLSSTNGTAQHTYRRRKETITIVFNGSINTWTDVSLLAGALEEVLLIRKNVNFVQFGKSVTTREQSDKLKSISDNPDIRARISWLGKISAQEADEIYKSSDICLSADIDSLETRYGWRTRYYRALREGIVVVATLGNDFAESLSREGVGLFVKPGDKSLLVKALLALIDNHELRNALSIKGMQYADTMAKSDYQYEELLRWCANPSKMTAVSNWSLAGIITVLRNAGSWARWHFLKKLK